MALPQVPFLLSLLRSFQCHCHWSVLMRYSVSDVCRCTTAKVRGLAWVAEDTTRSSAEGTRASQPWVTLSGSAHGGRDRAGLREWHWALGEGCQAECRASVEIWSWSGLRTQIRVSLALLSCRLAGFNDQIRKVVSTFLRPTTRIRHRHE